MNFHLKWYSSIDISLCDCEQSNFFNLIKLLANYFFFPTLDRLTCQGLVQWSFTENPIISSLTIDSVLYILCCIKSNRFNEVNKVLNKNTPNFSFFGNWFNFQVYFLHFYPQVRADKEIDGSDTTLSHVVWKLTKKMTHWAWASENQF